MTEVATMPETEIEPPAPESSSEAAAAVEPPEIPAENAVAPTTEKVGSKPYDTDAHLHEIEHAEQLVAAREGEWEALKSETKGAKDAFDAAVERLRRIIRGGDAPLFSQGNAAVKDEPAVAERKPLEWSVSAEDADILTANSCMSTDGVAWPFVIGKEQHGYNIHLSDEALVGDEQPPYFPTLEEAKAACEAIDEKSWGLSHQNPAEGSAATAGLDESWKLVALADLENPAIPASKLKILAENSPPILTMGELVAFQNTKGDWWVKDLKGLGAGGAEAIAASCDAYWARNPLGKKTEPAPASEAFDDAAIKDDTILTVIGRPGLIVAKVAQRVGGPWAYWIDAKVNRRTLKVAWAKNFGDRQGATAEAIESVEIWLSTMKDITTRDKPRVDEIREAIAAAEAPERIA